MSPLPLRRRPAWRTIGAAAGLALLLAGCGDSAGEDDGRDAQAVEQLESFGLSSAAARCVVDEVGAESVVEAADLNAFAESQEFIDAAADCGDDD